MLTIPDDYEDLLAAADEVPFSDTVTEDDLAALFYTSGPPGSEGCYAHPWGLVSQCAAFHGHLAL